MTHSEISADRAVHPVIPTAGRAARPTLLLTLVAVLCIIVPFIFWYGIWFGRPLSDKDIGQYLSEEHNTRKIQHALSQIADRIVEGDPSVKQWVPRITALARHPKPEVRITVAWVMGQDNHSVEFHHALLQLLKDPQVMVRRNAALSLVRFGDASGRAELVSMLHPYSVRAPAAGWVSTKLEVNQPVGSGTLLARIRPVWAMHADRRNREQAVDVQSPLPGRVQRVVVPDGSMVRRGDELVLVNSGTKQVLAALQGLYLIGESADLPAVEQYTNKGSDVPSGIRRQASLTAQAIRTRAEQKATR